MFLMWLGEQITGARRRQRHLADHLFRHRRGAAPSRSPARSSSAVRAPSRPRSCWCFLAVMVDRGHHGHRLHGARAAPAPRCSIPSARSATRWYGGDIVAPAAQAEHGRRHPADLRLVAAAAAGRRWRASAQRRAGPRLAATTVTALLGPRPAALHGLLCRGHDHLLLPSSTPRSCSIRPRPRTI